MRTLLCLVLLRLVLVAPYDVKIITFCRSFCGTQVNLAALFKDLRLVAISEMTLTGTKLKRDVKRLQWKTTSTTSTKDESHLWTSTKPVARADLPVVDLGPMEIRTFIVRLQRQ